MTHPTRIVDFIFNFESSKITAFHLFFTKQRQLVGYGFAISNYSVSQIKATTDTYPV